VEHLNEYDITIILSVTQILTRAKSHRNVNL
jgi:hypothetical protein